MTPSAHLPDAPTPAQRVARLLAILGVTFCMLGPLAGQIRARLHPTESIAALLFAAWPYVPFALALAMLAPRRVSAARSIAMVVVSLLAMAAYASTALSERPGSTAGLLFLTMPVWQLLGLGLALAIATTIEQRAPGRR